MSDMIKFMPDCDPTPEQRKAVRRLWDLSKAYCRNELSITHFAAGALYGDQIYLSVWFTDCTGRIFRSCQFFIGPRGGIEYPVGVTGRRKRFYADKFSNAVEEYSSN